MGLIFTLAGYFDLGGRERERLQPFTRSYLSLATIRAIIWTFLWDFDLRSEREREGEGEIESRSRSITLPGDYIRETRGLFEGFSPSRENKWQGENEKGRSRKPFTRSHVHSHALSLAMLRVTIRALYNDYQAL